METLKIIELMEDLETVDVSEITELSYKKGNIKLSYIKNNKTIQLEFNEKDLKCPDKYQNNWYCNNLCAAKETCKKESLLENN